MPRLLSTLLLALALLLSPLAMVGVGSAHAAMPETASMAMHCAEEGSAPPHGKRAPGMDVGCATACAAVPATVPSAAEQPANDPIAPPLPGDQLLSGIHPEGETPPPRIRPEI